MKKRYSISQRKCEQGLVAFYGYVAGMCNIEVTEKSTFDCTKISDEEIGTKLLLCGPKANLIGAGYEVEVEDGFVIEGK